MSIPSLSVYGTAVHDVGKPQCLNQYFSSFFSSLLSNGSKNRHAFHSGLSEMDDIEISTRGIEKLLEGLNISQSVALMAYPIAI